MATDPGYRNVSHRAYGLDPARDSLTSRKALRLQHKKLRDSMTHDEVMEKSRDICDKVLSSQYYKNADIVLGYYPLGNEVDVKPIITAALRDGKKVALPRVHRGGTSMDFYFILSLSDVSEGSFHVMEPTEKCDLFDTAALMRDAASPIHMPADISRSIILVPGVVFDKECNRYGYGKGYYDRYLPSIPDSIKIGIAFCDQLEEKLDVSEYDIKMDYVVTETQIIAGKAGDHHGTDRNM